MITVILRIPFGEGGNATPTQDDLDTILTVIRRGGYSTTLDTRLGRFYVAEEGISAEGVTEAVLDAKRRAIERRNENG